VTLVKERFFLVNKQTATALLKSLCLLVLVAAFAAPISPANAQVSGKAFEGFQKNKDDPIQIEADELQVLDGKNKAIFKGRVKVRQGSSTITTNKLTVSYGKKSGGGQGDVERLDLHGSVIVTSGKNTATADKGHYIVKSEDVVLEGNVVISQCNNVATGYKLVANLKTNVAQLKSKDTRVRTIIERGANKKQTKNC